MNLTKTSRYISLILRHRPDIIGITLDEHGWANVDELIAGVSKTQPLTRELLDEIVRSDDKQRYAFSPDKSLIRANQGHSIPVDVELARLRPPAVLYHGTAEKSVSGIEAKGLLPMSRLYVHLTDDLGTAVKVGRRHGKAVVYRIDSREMAQDGYAFFRSANGVWLTKEVPVKYLEKLSPADCAGF